MSSKTVMYVTHQIDFLPVADLILVSKSDFTCDLANKMHYP